MRRFPKASPQPVLAPVLARAPGRVNLIGEHTDYNEGFVLPIAIDRGTEVSAWPSPDDAVLLESVAYGENARFRVDDDPATLQPPWARYVAGVLSRLRKNGLPAVGFRAKIDTDLPLGGGLSSSAALTCAGALAAVEVARLGGAAVPPWLEETQRLAAICRDAERVARGVRCGIMDPYTALHARSGQALLLDCRDLSVRFVPLPADRISVVVADSGVRHSLAAGGYNDRRGECEAALARLNERGARLRSLRDLDASALASGARHLPPTLLRRARHVVTENARTQEAADSLARSDWARFGRLMTESHESLRKDYEVSCPELDALVEIALCARGVFGSRMTGGGFGGSTVTLVEPGSAKRVVETLATEYERRTGRKAEVRVVRPSGAAGVRRDPAAQG